MLSGCTVRKDGVVGYDGWDGLLGQGVWNFVFSVEARVAIMEAGNIKRRAE